jgi:hypothetical protein
MIYWLLPVVVFAFTLGVISGFVAGVGWRAMFSGPFRVAYTDSANTYPGTQTERGAV